MSVGDPIADLLTRVRNGHLARKKFVEVPLSKVKVKVVKLLVEEGFISGFLLKEEAKGLIRIYLKYDAERKPVIQGIKRVSKQSCRRYVRHGEIPYIFGGMGAAILSTSKGIMLGRKARKQGIGGELLAVVW